MTNEMMLKKLANSKFRASFKLKEKDFKYIEEKGLGKIKEHAIDFVKNRLSDTSKVVDGKQTPMRGHPVFVAQHATATCCRECLCKWHKIEKGRPLTDDEIDYVVGIIIAWIENQLPQKN
jgi:hypothetical protein